MQINTGKNHLKFQQKYLFFFLSFFLSNNQLNEESDLSDIDENLLDINEAENEVEKQSRNQNIASPVFNM